MTINQAIDKITELDSKALTLEQQDLKLSLFNLKESLGGKVKIENVDRVKNIIKYGNKEGFL